MAKYHFPKRQLEDSLKRAFDGETDFIIMDGQDYRNDFLREGVQLGIKRGWLYQGEDINEEQYTAHRFYLTRHGKNKLLRD